MYSNAVSCPFRGFLILRWYAAHALDVHLDKVQARFLSEARDDNVAAGRALIERECARLALTSLDYRAIAAQLGQPTVEDLFAAVGSGDLSANQLLRAAQNITGSSLDQPMRVVAPLARHAGEVIQVDGVGNMLTHFARCCMPVPGDRIEGFITRSRGVTVHRSDCNRFLSLHGESPERIIAVSWGGTDQERFEVDIAIEAYDRKGLLADITGVMARNKVNVTAINTYSQQADHTAHMQVTAEVESLEVLGQILGKLGQLDNVITAQRIAQRS